MELQGQRAEMPACSGISQVFMGMKTVDPSAKIISSYLKQKEGRVQAGYEAARAKGGDVCTLAVIAEYAQNCQSEPAKQVTAKYSLGKAISMIEM